MAGSCYWWSFELPSSLTHSMISSAGSLRVSSYSGEELELTCTNLRRLQSLSPAEGQNQPSSLRCGGEVAWLELPGWLLPYSTFPGHPSREALWSVRVSEKCQRSEMFVQGCVPVILPSLFVVLKE